MTPEYAPERHPFLAGLTAETIGALAPRAVEFPAGAFLFRADEAAQALYLICAGRIALEQNIPSRGSTQLESLAAGEILGLSWLFPPYRWHLDARAVEPVRVAVIDAVPMRTRMADDAVVGNALATRLLRHLYDRLERVRMQRLDLYRAEP